MKQENFNITDTIKEKYLPDGFVNLRKPRILVAPLDWGLGHTTRCIPVIYELLNQQCEVSVASEGAQEALLEQEFPGLKFLRLPGYNVKYGRSGGSMLWNILFQSPKIIRAIRQENNWLKQMILVHHFDAVISDNRFGLYHLSVPSIIITHQLHIKTSLGNWSERLVRQRNYKYINRFAQCWIPDEEGETNLAGELSHPIIKPAVKIHYLGILSRLNKTCVEEQSGHLLIIISGPEPQRTIFEEKIIRDIAHYQGTATIVRGLPGNATIIPSTNTLKFYNHLPAEALNKEMNMAEYVISRSGYSTIMDARKLQKKTIFIPTPGQTEQEYLARYLQEKKMAIYVSQRSFSLSSALQQAKAFSYNVGGETKENRLTPVISSFLQSLSKH